MNTEIIADLEHNLQRSKRGLIANRWDKAEQHEREYSRVYDKLALLGVNKRRRLRKKYRG